MQNTIKELDIVQLMYCSRAAHSGESVLFERDIEDIVIFGQIYNFLHDITGALMTDGEMFAHIIEGPAVAVKNLYLSIAKDRRHSNVTTLQYISTHVRLFNHWPIAFIRVENIRHIRTLNAQSTLDDFREASVFIMKALRPVLFR